MTRFSQAVRTIRFRVTAWHAAIFLVSAALLFTLIDYTKDT